MNQPEAKKKDSQVKQIFEYMMGGSKITAIDALNKFRCFNLKGRIFDIWTEYKIRPERKMIAIKSMGETKHICQYWISPQPKRKSR